MLTLNKDDLIELRAQIVNTIGEGDPRDAAETVRNATLQGALLIAATIEHSVDALIDALWRVSGRS